MVIQFTQKIGFLLAFFLFPEKNTKYLQQDLNNNNNNYIFITNKEQLFGGFSHWIAF
jgi:hypothetical protein